MIEILRGDQGILIIFQGFAMFVLHLYCKALGRYDKGLVSCRSGWGQGECGTGCLSLSIFYFTWL